MTFSQPFNNPSAQPALVEMWRSAINKARVEVPPPPLLPTTIEANFDGGGQPLVAGLGGVIRVTFPCKILNCYIHAGTVGGSVSPATATASIYLGLGETGAWASGSVSLGTVAISGTSEATSDTTLWYTDELQPGDLIPYGLLTFSGSATWITVSIGVRRIDVVGVDVTELTDGSATDFTNASGDPFTVRN